MGRRILLRVRATCATTSRQLSSLTAAPRAPRPWLSSAVAATTVAVQRSSCHYRGEPPSHASQRRPQNAPATGSAAPLLRLCPGHARLRPGPRRSRARTGGRGSHPHNRSWAEVRSRQNRSRRRAPLLGTAAWRSHAGMHTGQLFPATAGPKPAPSARWAVRRRPADRPSWGHRPRCRHTVLAPASPLR